MRVSVAAYIMFSIFLMTLLLPVTSAQPCLTTADADCGGSVDILELNAHIRAWYRCSRCISDLFNAIRAYYGIPFCGDWKCNVSVGEDCSSCSVDCGCGAGEYCANGLCIADLVNIAPIAVVTSRPAGSFLERITDGSNGAGYSPSWHPYIPNKEY